MLDDAERKLLRVLFNFFAKNRRMPVWRELTAITGKHRADVARTLLALEQKQYIMWLEPVSPHTVVLIEGWEQRDRLPQRSASIVSEVLYWTEH